MNPSQQRFLAWITPGARALVLVFVAVYLTATVGGLVHLLDLAGWLELAGPKLFAGQAWRLVAYALLSPGIGALMGNCLGAVLMGVLLEKFWSRGEFWFYAAVAAAGAGLAHVAIHPADGVVLVGAGPVFFAMLIAVAFVRGREVVQMPPVAGMLTWHLVAAATAIQLVITALYSVIGAAMVMAAGAMTGYAYLWLRHQWLMSRDSRVVQSERINRLEL